MTLERFSWPEGLVCASCSKKIVGPLDRELKLSSTVATAGGNLKSSLSLSF